MLIDTSNLTFKSRKSIQIRMTDLDPFGHVNNGVIYSYYDVGRLHYLRQMDEDIQWEKMDKVIVHTECDFMESIRFEDDISVETKIIEVGKRSIKMIQRIVDNNSEGIKSTCFSVLAGYDRENNTSKEIAQGFKERIMEFET